MLSACYEVVTGRAPDMLRAYLLAVLVQMVVVNTLAGMGYLQVTIPLFFGLATALGGFIFGLGPFPRLGVTGAALATFTGRSIGVAYQFYRLLHGTERAAERALHVARGVFLAACWLTRIVFSMPRKDPLLVWRAFATSTELGGQP